ncbi:MAG: hypothetical protein MRY74_01580 [Neomegalonema sp.]|nr:hypothetical protein [Neomegalonema sp.]
MIRVGTWSKRLTIATHAVVAAIFLAAPRHAGAQEWRFVPAKGGFGPAAAHISTDAGFTLRLGCAGRRKDRAPTAAPLGPHYAVDAPAPIQLFVPAAGFVGDGKADLTKLGAATLSFRVDGGRILKVNMVYSKSTQEFVGAIAHNGRLVRALQAGWGLEVRADIVGGFGAAPLYGSRRAIDALRAYCPNMQPSRRSRPRAAPGFAIGPIRITPPTVRRGPTVRIRAPRFLR